MALPDKDDVVIRQRHGNPSIVFVLGTPSAPDQFTLRTRDEAISQAWPMPNVSMCERGLPRATTTSCCSGRFESSRPNLRGRHDGEAQKDESERHDGDRRRTRVVGAPASVTDSDVARRAYELTWHAAREHGHDVDDWTAAERELRARATTT